MTAALQRSLGRFHLGLHPGTSKKRRNKGKRQNTVPQVRRSIVGAAVKAPAGATPTDTTGANTNTAVGAPRHQQGSLLVPRAATIVAATVRTVLEIGGGPAGDQVGTADQDTTRDTLASPGVTPAPTGVLAVATPTGHPQGAAAPPSAALKTSLPSSGILRSGLFLKSTAAATTRCTSSRP